ncbi:MAG: OsmC family protein [Acidimicrobiales bacterium]|jgi:osmotically inducible protein OsmC
MPARTGEAEWKGDLREGGGEVSFGSGAFRGAYSFKSRFEDEEGKSGTNPEEMIAAAHAACYSMALSNALATKGHTADRVHTTATVHLVRSDSGFGISRIDLVCEAEVPGIDEEAFRLEAEGAKANCPVSKALAAVEITLAATLL